MPWNPGNSKPLFLVKNVKTSIFLHNPFLKRPFTQIKFPADLYDVANKLNKLVFESCRKCALYAISKKVKFPQIATNFSKTL